MAEQRHRYPNSRTAAARLLAVTPGGAQTGSKAPGRAGPSGDYPAVLSGGLGPMVRDADGFNYLDFIAGLAAVGLGHAYPAVTESVAFELRCGSLLSLPTLTELAASERLIQFLRWPEQVRWVKTGSESTEAAIRVARAATGRDFLLTVTSGYHAWHSWFQAVKPQHPGVPREMEDLIYGIEYGERAITESALKGGVYAAVILEPAPVTGGGDGEWLRWLVETAHRHGTLVIFDEMVWGLRLANGGAGEYFGVQPDLATFGKALGNGVPVACLVGPRDLMRHATLVSGTFGGDGLGLAAALAVMDIYERQQVVVRLRELGARFQDGVNARGGAVRCTGYPVHPVLQLPGTTLGTDTGPLQMSLLLQGLADRGVLFHPAGGNVMFTMTDKQVDDAVQAVHEAGMVVTELMASGSPDALRQALRGQPYQAAFSRAPVTR